MKCIAILQKKGWNLFSIRSILGAMSISFFIDVLFNRQAPHWSKRFSKTTNKLHIWPFDMKTSKESDVQLFFVNLFTIYIRMSTMKPKLFWIQIWWYQHSSYCKNKIGPIKKIFCCILTLQSICPVGCLSFDEFQTLEH